MAITSVPYKPVWISPAYNPIIWSVESSKVNSVDFKYVFDIYVVGTTVPIQRIKQRANPAGFGMIDISTLVQGYIDSSNVNAAMTQGELTIDYDNAKVYSDNNLMSQKYLIKVGEEYTFNGVTQIYNGQTDTAGEPSFLLYSGNTQNGNLTTPVTVFPASMEDQEQQWQMRSTFQSGIFGGNPFNANTNYDHNIGLAHPLNYAPLNQSLYQFDNIVLSYLNWTPISGSQPYTIFGFRFERKSSTGTIVNTNDVPMLTSSGFGQRDICTNTIGTTLDAKYSLVHVLASPDKLAQALGWSPISAGQTISIQGYNQSTGCDFDSPATQESRFQILEYCTPLYPRVRLSWFNTLGGRDYMNFTMFTEKTIQTTQSNYNQEQIDYSSALPVPVAQPNTVPFGNASVIGGMKPYAKQAETMYAIQTDWLLQEDLDVLEGLVKSPQVLAYIKDPYNTQADNIPYNCVVTNTSYTTKNVRQGKMVQASFTIKLAMSQNIQTI
jgi:hypothetical protein